MTVVVATTRRWPAADLCLQVVVPQIRAVGGELILADGHGTGLDAAQYPDVVWLQRPGADRLALHAWALERARGDVVAITEDHASPTSGWCEAILRAHRERPDAPVIIGAVQNASRRRVSDRASFLLTSGPYLPPLEQLPDRTPPYNNISIKRAVLPPSLARGEFEFDLVPRLFAAGQASVDDHILVDHVQPISMSEALAMHFHNGRTHGGAYVTDPFPLRLRRARRALTVPRSLAAETSRELARRPGAPYGARDIAGVAAIATAHTLGYLAGLVTGSGSSPRRIT